VPTCETNTVALHRIPPPTVQLHWRPFKAFSSKNSRLLIHNNILYYKKVVTYLQRVNIQCLLSTFNLLPSSKIQTLQQLLIFKKNNSRTSECLKIQGHPSTQGWRGNPIQCYSVVFSINQYLRQLPSSHLQSINSTSSAFYTIKQTLNKTRQKNTIRHNRASQSKNQQKMSQIHHIQNQAAHVNENLAYNN